MGIGDFFAKINDKVQEKYQSMSDFFSNKGIPLNKYNEFLENHGIPSHWFSIFALLLIIIIIVLLASLIFKFSLTATVNLVDDQGNPIADSVYLTFNVGQEQVYAGNVKSGDELSISGLSRGDNVTIIAQLKGYKLYSGSPFIADESKEILNLVFIKDIPLGAVQLRILDAETETIIINADVNVLDSDNSVLFSGKTNDSGILELNSIPLNTTLKISVLAEGYLELNQPFVPNQNETIDFKLEPKQISFGELGTITFVVTSLSQPIPNAKITIYNANTKTVMAEDVTDNEGKVPINVTKGIPLRYVVLKDGFNTFDSEELNKNITLRKDTDTINVYFEVGGSKLKVIVKDEEKKEILGATVAVYSNNGLIIDTKTTDMYGQAEFSGIDIKRANIVSAYAIGNYYPSSKVVSEKDLGTVELVLKKIDLKTTARTNIFVATKDNKPVANATVELFMINENNSELPLYFPDNKTSITGLYTVMLEPNTNIKVNVSTQELFGSKTASLVSGDNKIEIIMMPIEKTSTIYIYGVNGFPLSGAKLNVKTETDTLYDGNTNEKGSAQFYPGSAKEVEVIIVDKEDNVYTKLVDVKDKMEITLSPFDISKDPKISFTGIYDAYGNKLNGVKVDSTYYFKFSVIWPKDQKNGSVHVRVGEPNISGASMQYAILGADSISSVGKEYGLYYTENSDESNVKDLQIFGRAGIRNKWVNVIYNNPKGLTELKVKVNVANALDLNKLLLYYRVNSFDGKEYFADPKTNISTQDSKLKRLHAEARSEEINVFSSLFECSSVSNICYSYSFNDGFIKYNEFSAVLGETYSLDLDFFSKSDISSSIEFSSNSLLKTTLLNNISEDLINFSPQDINSESLNYNLVLKANEHKKFRVYFTADKLGNGNISFSSSLLGINKSIDFRIDGQKNLNVSLNSQGMIEFGKPIIFNVFDAQGKIGNAIISVTENNGTANVFLKGDNTKDKGADGQYVINPLPSGIYNYEVRAPQHVTSRGNFVVSRFGVLSVKPEHEIRIPKGKQQRDYEIEIANISNLSITNLGYEVLRDDAKAFNVTYRYVKSNLLPQTTNKLIVSVSTDTQQVVYGDQDLIISGTINKNEVVRQIVHLSLISNTDLDSECLVVNPGELVFNLYDSQKNKQTGNLTFENKCDLDFTNLVPKLVVRDGENYIDAIDFSSTSLSLNRGLTKTIKYSVAPKITVPQNGMQFELFLNVDTEYFRKQIPVHAKITHSFGALQISVTNPELTLTSNQFVQMPLFISNLGTVPLRNVTIMVQPYNQTPYTSYVPYSDYPQSEYYNPLLNGPQVRTYDSASQYQQSLNPYYGNPNYNLGQGQQTFVNTQVLPNPRMLQFVMPNQTTMSQLTIRGPGTQQSNVVSAVTVMVRGFTATDNKPVTAVTPIFFTISSPKCFKVNVPTNEIYFRSSKLNVKLENKNISITNECAEPLILELPISKTIRDKTKLDLSVDNTTIMPKQTVAVNSILSANEEMNATETVLLLARGQNTGTQYGVNVNFNFILGRMAQQKEKAPYDEKEFGICDQGDKKVVKYPKVGQDCSQSYCDGQTAADHLKGQINGFITSYKTMSSKYTKNLKTTNCDVDSQSCAFAKIGVEKAPITLYLMHDTISGEGYLKETVQEAIKEIKDVSFLPTKNFDIEKQSTAQFNRLFIDSEISKCGKYTISFEGAFGIRDKIMQKDYYNILIKAEYENTPECAFEIQNAALFLPRDSKSDKDNTYGFLHGYVDYDKAAYSETFAKEISKRIFSQERIASGKANTLFVTRATLSNHPMSVKIDTEDNPQVIVTLSKDIDVSKNKEDAIKLIESFLKGSYIGCIDADGKGARVVSATDDRTGQYQLTVSNKSMRAGVGKEQIKFTVAGPTAGTGELYVQPTTTEGYTVRIIDESENLVSTVNFIAGKTKEYFLEVNFTDPSRAIDFSKTDPLTLILKPINGEEISEKILFTQCGVEPYLFVKNVATSELKNKNYYAQMHWTNGNTSKDGCEVFKEIQEYKKGPPFLTGSTPSSRCNADNIAPVSSVIKDNFWQATAAAGGLAFAVCMAAEGLTSIKSILGPWGIGMALFTCGIVVSDLVASSAYANHRNNIAMGLPGSERNIIDGLHDSLNNFVLTDWMFDDYESTPGAGDSDKLKSAQNLQDTLSYPGAAALGAATKVAIPSHGTGEKAYTNPIRSMLNAKEQAVTDDFFKEFSRAVDDAGKKGVLPADPANAKSAEKLFDTLASDPKFKTKYDAFKKLAKEKGIAPEKLFTDKLAEEQKNALKLATDAADDLSKKIALQDKVYQDIALGDAKKLALETDLTNAEAKLAVENAKAIPNPNEVTRLGDDVKNIKAELKSTKDSLDDLKNIQKPKIDLEVTSAENAMGDGIKKTGTALEPKTGAWNKTKSFFAKSKAWGLAKGLLKGVISAEAATLTYKNTWVAMMSSSIKGAMNMNITLPDAFVRNKSYVMTITNIGPGNYSAVISETDPVNVIGFCKPENSKVGYIAKDTLIPATTGATGSTGTTGSTGPGVTGADGACTSYANLFEKYGNILKSNTSGAMDGKNLIAQTNNESRFKANITSPSPDSSATGLGQFVQDTYCKITLDLSNGKYTEYLAVFDNSQLSKYDSSSFGELYSKTCNGKTQCNGGYLIGADPRCTIDYSKDPRANPEIGVMYMAILLNNLYKSKGSVRQVTESYVAGPGCITGDGAYNTARNDCKNYFAGNPSITTGGYWTNYQKYLSNQAQSCLASAGSSRTGSGALASICKPETKIALVGDSITAGYSSHLSRTLNTCGTIVSKSSTAAYNASGCPSNSLACVSAPTSWMLSQLKSEYASGKKYDLVIILGGTNDLGATGTNLEPIKNNLLEMYSLAKTNGAKVVAVTVVPRKTNNASTSSLNSWIKSLGTSQNVDVVVDTTSEIMTANGNVLPDDPHGFSGVIANDIYRTVFS